MTDQFFVDADGLDGGRDGFDGKSAELRTLAQRVQSLANPGRIQDAAGNDKNGNEFSKTHIQSAAEIYDGINAWALAVEATRDAISDMATSFREADQGAYDGSNALFKNFTDLNEKVRKADPGDSSDAPTEDQYAVRVRARIADHGTEPLPGEEPRFRHLSIGRPVQHELDEREGEVTPLEPARLFVRSEKPVHAAEETPGTWLASAGRAPAKSIPAEPAIPPEEPLS
ncbi:MULTISPECIES: hypothetical protein [Actinomycetes]|uniref:hypothetical protein n=1 Tax=Actinomycetes TaxID=1760 RepID=UPI0001B5863D|nr:MULTISPECIES: hypothetical protein [Actinomycetes]EFL09302.1 predicted protein [Streptomyces sp. AA4]